MRGSERANLPPTPASVHSPSSGPSQRRPRPDPVSALRNRIRTCPQLSRRAFHRFAEIAKVFIFVDDPVRPADLVFARRKARYERLG